jgi:hypothetical protein
LLHLRIRHGHIDTDYIAERTCGFEQVRRVVRSPPLFTDRFAAARSMVWPDGEQ